MIGFRGLLHKVPTATRLALHGPLRCRKFAFSVIANKDGLEIGGPSTVFRKLWYLPLYDKVGALDNVDFRQETVWASHSEGYVFSPHKPRGRNYFCEGSELRDVPDGTYDFLLSSHNLEHFANPLKALYEWQRVIKPGGHLIVVLPNFAWTLDAGRQPTTLKHMVDDYANHIGEDDLTHVEEICAGRIDKSSQSEADFRRMLLDNINHRMIHHHVFDESNSKQLLEAADLKVISVEPYPPIHIFLIAQVPKRVEMPS